MDDRVAALLERCRRTQERARQLRQRAKKLVEDSPVHAAVETRLRLFLERLALETELDAPAERVFAKELAALRRALGD